MTDEEYKDILTRWLTHKINKWQDTVKNSSNAAADAASFYAAAYYNFWSSVVEGKPEKWAEDGGR